MPEKYKSSGLMLHELTVKPYAMATVEFLEVKPNYFRVQNFGDSRIYCGTSRTPTENNYDFACKPDGMFMYAEPNTRSFLYIYNPSGNEARVKVVAFAHEFDPLALVFSGIELDFSGTKLEADTAISSFNASLPSGANKIGSVDVANLKDYSSVLGNLLSAVKAPAKSTAVYVESANLTSDGINSEPGEGKTFTNINFLSNDGDANIWLSVDQTGYPCYSIMVKPGEVLQNVKINAYNLFVNAGAGATSAVRAVYEVTEV